MKKKNITFIAFIIVVLGLVGCGSSNSVNDNSNSLVENLIEDTKIDNIDEIISFSKEKLDKANSIDYDDNNNEIVITYKDYYSKQEIVDLTMDNIGKQIWKETYINLTSNSNSNLKEGIKNSFDEDINTRTIVNDKNGEKELEVYNGNVIYDMCN